MKNGPVSLALGSVAVVLLAFLAASAHADTIFGTLAPLNSTATTDTGFDGNPTVASDGNGHVVAIWITTDTQGGTIGSDGDLMYSYSSDSGATWSTAAVLDPNATTDGAGDQYPSLATDGNGNWVVAWQSDNSLGDTIGTDIDILFSRSTNNGASWSTPTFLNSSAPTSNATEGEVVVTGGGSGEFTAVWYASVSVGSGTGVDYDIHYARSTDGGASWSAEKALNTDAGTDSKFDQMATVASDGADSRVAMWLGSGTDSVYDLMVCRSTNDGKNWKDQDIIGQGSGMPHIVSDGAGNWVAVWALLNSETKGPITPDYDVMFSRSTDDGATWSTPAFLNTDALGDSYDDKTPTIAYDGHGTWLAAWQSQNPLNGGDAADWDIQQAVSTDDGDTWTQTKALNSNATTDLGSDVNPQIVTFDQKSWVAVWECYDPLTNKGSDGDIVFARSFPSHYELTNPNGGGSWVIGKKKKIEWESSNGAPNKVKLILLKDGNVVTTIKSSTKDDGLFKWEVPAGVGTGSGFSVRIEAKSDSTDADESDGTFKIKASK